MRAPASLVTSVKVADEIWEVNSKDLWKLAGSAIGTNEILLPDDWSEIMVIASPNTSSVTNLQGSTLRSDVQARLETIGSNSVGLVLDISINSNTDTKVLVNYSVSIDKVYLAEFVWYSADYQNSAYTRVYYK